MCYIFNSLKVCEGTQRRTVQAITTRIGVQLPNINAREKETESKQVLTIDEERVDQPEKSIKKNQLKSSDSPQVKTTVPINPLAKVAKH